jgi:hypothetical protein
LGAPHGGGMSAAESCAFVDRLGNEVRTSRAAYQEIRLLREKLEEIEYHTAQLSSYIAIHNPTDKALTSARHHVAKIAALAKASREQVSA